MLFVYFVLFDSFDSLISLNRKRKQRNFEIILYVNVGGMWIFLSKL